MDPNVCLGEIRALLADLDRLDERIEGLPDGYLFFDDLCCDREAMRVDLIDWVRDLLDWLERGGFAPDWRK
jgi:hypothetical protein